MFVLAVLLGVFIARMTAPPTEPTVAPATSSALRIEYSQPLPIAARL